MARSDRPNHPAFASTLFISVSHGCERAVECEASRIREGLGALPIQTLSAAMAAAAGAAGAAAVPGCGALSCSRACDCGAADISPNSSSSVAAELGAASSSAGDHAASAVPSLMVFTISAVSSSANAKRVGTATARCTGCPLGVLPLGVLPFELPLELGVFVLASFGVGGGVRGGAAHSGEGGGCEGRCGEGGASAPSFKERGPKTFRAAT